MDLGGSIVLFQNVNSDFHNFLEKSFDFNETGRVKIGAICVGRQPTNSHDLADTIWVLNESVHINGNGELVELENSKYVWPGIGGPCIETMFGKGQSTDIKSSIFLPLESKNSLKKL